MVLVCHLARSAPQQFLKISITCRYLPRRDFTVCSQPCTEILRKASLSLKKVTFSYDLAVHSSHATEAPASVADDRHGYWRWKRCGTPKNQWGNRFITNDFAAEKYLMEIWEAKADRFFATSMSGIRENLVWAFYLRHLSSQLDSSINMNLLI